MPIGSFVYRRGDTYSFRCKVPVRLRSLVSKREFLFAIGTRDQDVARLVCAAIGLRVKRLWQDVERVADYEDVERLIRDWFKGAVDKAWRDNFLDPERDRVVGALVADLERAGSGPVDFEQEKTRFADSYAEHRLRQMEEGIINPSSFRHEARALAASASLPLTDSEIEIVAGQMCDGDAAIAESVIQWASGKTDHQPTWEPALPERTFPRKPKPEPSTAGGLIKPQPVSAGITLTQAFARYIGERKPAVATEAAFQTTIRRFVEVFGDKDVGLITKRDVAGFKDVLLKIPSRLKPAERQLTVQNVIKLYADRPEVARLAADTINNKHMTAISVVLRWACDNGYVEHVVSREVRVRTKKSTAPKRYPYTLEDLNLIFSWPPFTKGERPTAGAGEAAVWLPILALYTGARLNELGTLHLGDARTESGVDLLFFREGKTDNARRRVPLHDEVKRLGFLEYVASRREHGGKDGDKLFPLIRAATAKGKKETSPFSNWWRRCAGSVIPDPKKSFHSFRHTVKRTMRNADVDKTLRDAVMGHEADDVAETYGLDGDGVGYDVSNLNAAIQKIDYPGLKITLAPVPPPKRKRYRRYVPKASRGT